MNEATLDKWKKGDKWTTPRKEHVKIAHGTTLWMNMAGSAHGKKWRQIMMTPVRIGTKKINVGK